jgi:hypothetical protein
MRQNSKLGYVIAGVVALTAMLSYLVWADSNEPFGIQDITIIRSSRANTSTFPPSTVQAEAGNITELRLVANAITKSWQGYYGNISGTITLQDVLGNVFYNWTTAEPQGEIYASTNTTVSWLNIICFNFSGNSTFTGINLTTEESRYGIQPNDADGIDETYTQASLDSNFFVGSRNITSVSATAGTTCQSTNTFTYGLQGVTGDFENTLLTDLAGALVFTTLIENDQANNLTDKIGFNNNTHDFQLLVAEDGHDGQEDTTTTYYFWAEID